MGCAQSKIENEESISRCKDRRNFMKEAVTARNAFASGHSGYAMALKNTEVALSDYAQEKRRMFIIPEASYFTHPDFDFANMVSFDTGTLTSSSTVGILSNGSDE